MATSPLHLTFWRAHDLAYPRVIMDKFDMSSKLGGHLVPKYNLNTQISAQLLQAAHPRLA